MYSRSILEQNGGLIALNCLMAACFCIGKRLSETAVIVSVSRAKEGLISTASAPTFPIMSVFRSKHQLSIKELELSLYREIIYFFSA